jgi:hypothetical protein
MRLGFAYNPVYSCFSRTPVVVFEDSDIQINRLPQQREGMVYANVSKQRNKIRAHQLQTDFTVRSVAGAGAQYSSTTTSGSSTSSASRTFESSIIIATATLGTDALTPSKQLRLEINKLPPWESSEDVKAQYRAFFDKHGTHINDRAALGGVLRLTSHGNFDAMQETVLKTMSGQASVPAGETIGANIAAAASRKKTEDVHSTSDSGAVSVFLEGGDAVASELTSAAKGIFDHHDTIRAEPRLQSWFQVRARWVDALQTDPVVCADHPDTHYCWLFGLDGIPDTQRKDLQRASEWYLRDEQPAPDSSAGPAEAPLIPRAKNLDRVEKALSVAQRKWWDPLKFWKRGHKPQC